MDYYPREGEDEGLIERFKRKAGLSIRGEELEAKEKKKNMMNAEELKKKQKAK